MKQKIIHNRIIGVQRQGPPDCKHRDQFAFQAPCRGNCCRTRRIKNSPMANRTAFLFERINLLILSRRTHLYYIIVRDIFLLKKR